MSARPQKTECTYVPINYTMLGDYSSSNNPDFFLSIPSTLTSLDPLWSTCTPALYGAWDPPTTLEAAIALTDTSQKTTILHPAAPAGRATETHTPTTTTAIPNRPSERLGPGVLGTPDLQTSQSADPKDSPINQDSQSMATGKIPLNILPNAKPEINPKSDINDPPTAPTLSEAPLTDAKTNLQSLDGNAYAETAMDASSSKIEETLAPGPNAVVESGSTHFLPAPPSTDFVSAISGSAVTPTETSKTSGEFSFEGLVTTPGAQAIVSGHLPYASVPDETLDDNLYPLSTSAAETKESSPSTVTNGSMVSPTDDLAEVKVGGQMISINEPAITISGTRISLGHSELYIDSSVLLLPTTTKDSEQGPQIFDVSPIQNSSGLVRGKSNDTNAIAFTGEDSRTLHIATKCGVALFIEFTWMMMARL